MSERPSRGGPRPYYGPVVGSEDDSNNGNDSIDESEFETQLSIGSQSIDLQESDENMDEIVVGDETTGTGVNDAIEILSPPDENEAVPDENEAEDEIVGGTGVNDAIEILSPPDENEADPDENEAEDEIVGGTGVNDAIEILSPSDDEGNGEGSDVENIAFEEYKGKDISTGEVLDQNQLTLGSTSNPLLDPASASHRNATQAVDRSNAPTSGFQSAIAVQNQNRDQDVRSARKKKRSSSLGDLDEQNRNQPSIDSDRIMDRTATTNTNVRESTTSAVEHEGRNHLFGDGDESDPDYNPVDLANLTAEDQELVQTTRKLLSGTWFYLIVGVSAMIPLYDLFQKPWTLNHSQEDDMVAEYKNTATPGMRRVAEECHLLLIESTRILGDQFNTIGSHLPCTKEKQYHYNTLRRKPCYFALLPVIVVLEWSLVCNKNRSKKVSFRETYKRLFPLFTQNNVCCQHSSTFKDGSGTSSSQERINNLIKDFAQHFLLFNYCQKKNVEPIDVICCLYQMALQHYLVDVEYYRQDIWIRCIEPIHWIFKAENSIVRPIEMLLAMLYNTSSGKIMLELPKGITMEFLKEKAKKGILNHISNMKRNNDFSLSQIGKQIKRGCINLEDWSIEEDPTWWRHDESFVHSLAGKTFEINPGGWFRHRLDQLIAFKKTFQDEPFRPSSGRSEARSPLEFILGQWISSERNKWQKKGPGYTSAVDWKWSQMIEAKITTTLKYRVGAQQKNWDEKFTKFYLPILNCYNASNNQKTYFTKMFPSNKKKSNGNPIWTTQFRVDFPSKKFGDWKAVESARLRGIHKIKTWKGERHYLSNPPGVRYKQLELLDFLGVPRSQLNP